MAADLFQSSRPSSSSSVRLNCTYCLDDISGLRVKCVQCTDFILCLQCFSCGAEIGSHKKEHPYHFVDSGAINVFKGKTKWTDQEELQLLCGIEKYGFGKWEDISQHIKTRTADEARDEYIARYVDGTIGRLTWPEAYKRRTEKLRDLSDEPLTSPAATLPPLDVTLVEASQLGVMPLRDDFEREYDNEAECLVSSLNANSSADDDLDIALKLALVDIYINKLRERARCKRVCREYQLVSQFFSAERDKPKSQKVPCGEQEVEEKLRWLCQLQTSLEHDCLIKNIQRQRDLQFRLSELLKYRRNGITRFEEIPHFEQEVQSSRGSDSSSLLSLSQTAKRKRGKKGVKNNVFTIKNSISHIVSLTSSQGQELPPQPLQPVVNHPHLIEPSKHLLSKTEAQGLHPNNMYGPPLCTARLSSLVASSNRVVHEELCSSLNVTPSQFISIKTLLIANPNVIVETFPEKQIREHIISKGWLIASNQY